ncbi:MAG: hypothetical protein JRJ25_06980 [Deltaproteobacteria bacterium]|nr:hypothetical protein [Deltaproteobacteria bacterium]
MKEDKNLPVLNAQRPCWAKADTGRKGEDGSGVEETSWKASKNKGKMR